MRTVGRATWVMCAALVVLATPLLALGAACHGAGGSAAADAGPASTDAGPELDAEDAGDDGSFPESPRAPSSLALSDLVGLSSHPMLGSDPVSTSERAFEWAALAALGIHRMRTDFTWSVIEPARGSFQWTGYDALTSEAVAHGVDLLAVLDYGVPWAAAEAGSDTQVPPDDPADFAAFAVAVSQRYGATVTEYEVWNEPNNGLSFWHPTLNGDPARYGALLLATSKALLAAQPGAHVAYAGTVYDDLLPGPRFVAESLADTPGLAAALGTFGMHAYMIYPPFRGPESAVAGETPLLDKVATMSGVLHAAGAAPLPIWVTEIGWPTMSDDPADQQARYTVRAVVLAALAGADRVYLYTLRDGPHPDAYPPEDAFGMVTYSTFAADSGAPAPKPVFTAVQALLGALGAYHVTGRVPAQPGDVYLVALANGPASAWIAWRANDGAPAVPVTVPATGNVLLTHVDGTTAQDVAGASGYVLQVGPDPVIVTPR